MAIWLKKAKICKKIIATWTFDDYYNDFGETGERLPQP
jgi:hypothetical protein